MIESTREYQKILEFHFFNAYLWDLIYYDLNFHNNLDIFLLTLPYLYKSFYIQKFIRPNWFIFYLDS